MTGIKVRFDQRFRSFLVCHLKSVGSRFLYNTHQVNNDLRTLTGLLDTSRIRVANDMNINLKPFFPKRCGRFFGPDNGNNLITGAHLIYPPNQPDSKVSVRACYQ